MSVQNGKKSSKSSPSSKSLESPGKNGKEYISYSDNESTSTGSSESTSSIQTSSIQQNEEDPRNKLLKDKRLSKSLRKKFFHHFHNVEEDEEVLNKFSCALLSDLMLQGSLYITTNYFGFYSNVFGYVTKLLIPILTVEDITKERTAKIFPNAIGIVTPEQKHVFGSFMSRDNTLEYMRSIWEKAKSEAALLENELSEQGLDYSDLEDEPDGLDHQENQLSGSSKNLTMKTTRSLTYFKRVTRRRILLFATVIMLVILYLSATLLLYRITQMQDKYSMAIKDAENPDSHTLYHDILEWQAQLQSKSDGAIHNFLDNNLNQIARVKESLEALSSLLVDTVHTSDGNNATPQERPNR